jgi:hypothetical protein
MERLMRRRNPDKGLKLIEDAAAGHRGKVLLRDALVPLQPGGPKAMALL